MDYPKIIQGGMGAGVSCWQLARLVSMAGQLGVVSGTALDVILVRRLQDGDPNGDVRRGLAAFPDHSVGKRIVDEYFIEGGRKPGQPYKGVAQLNANPSRHAQELIVAGNFVEVFLAKEGHSGLIGINFLGKIQMATPACLYGAMLAGVDYVLMGAGIPIQIPGTLDKLSEHQPVALRLSVEEAHAAADHKLEFDPKFVVPVEMAPIRRPAFLAIVSSVVVTMAMLKRANGSVEGFIVEGYTAGGHNAPPRDGTQFTARGEPKYGPKDEADLVKIRALGKPFWPAGGYGYPARLAEALEKGAAGIQVGTPFALCRESGYESGLRQRIIAGLMNGAGDVLTDGKASPTGFPFKVLGVSGTYSDHDVYTARRRLCDLGYLRTPYQREDGAIGYRCAAEPIEQYLAKGGTAPETEGRKCLCNALMANIGLAQVQSDKSVELPLVTAGEDLTPVQMLVRHFGPDYSALDVLDYLLGKVTL